MTTDFTSNSTNVNDRITLEQQKPIMIDLKKTITSISSLGNIHLKCRLVLCYLFVFVVVAVF